jgi:N-acyl-D-amino-acid deacylase
MDALLENGTLIDGTGARPRQASILVRDGQIAEIDGVGNPQHRQVASSIDCAGLVIAPGFIDVHTHSDWDVIEARPNKVLQGVTTEIVGNCGYSLFPMRSDPGSLRFETLFEDLPRLEMRTAEDYFSAVEAVKPLVNVTSFTGHSVLRNYVMGMDRRAPSAKEQKEMEDLLEQSLDDGSIGFSTGLNCLPSSFAQFEEVAALCRVLKGYGAYYATHIRDYKFRVVQAVEEAIRVAEIVDVPVQLSHVQVVGKKCWHQLDTILELVDRAVNRGIDIGMDAYPYLAGSCSFIQFLPEWCQAGGLTGLLERLERQADRERISIETEDDMANTWADVLVCRVKHSSGESLIGRSLEEIAAEREQPPRQVAIDLLREQEGQLYVISFNSSEENLRKVLCHRLTSICSDSFIVKGLSHPRTFGSYPMFLGKYIRSLGWMSLEEAVVKISALPARRFQLADRGMLKIGKRADLVVFDAAAIGSQADYTSCPKAPDGIRMVFVNGEIVVDQGRLTGARAGEILRHTGTRR